jgi:hypothetical protein
MFAYTKGKHSLFLTLYSIRFFFLRISVLCVNKNKFVYVNVVIRFTVCSVFSGLILL